MNKRLSNIEALRILAMFMVIVLHYLDKGGLLTSTTETFTTHSYVAWLLESFAIVATNVYVLITGYFMCNSSFKVSRVVKIICQVLWYSILIPVVFVLVGAVDLGSFGLYEILQVVFPVHMYQYWFVTGYVVLLLLAPFLNAGIRQLSQKQLLLAAGFLVAYEALPKSVLPVSFVTDKAGYDILWMVCLYLIGAYIRNYGIPFFSNLKKSLLSYVAGVLLIFASLIAMRAVYFKLDAFGDNINFAYDYNHILCIFASVALFYTFLHIRLSEGKISNAVVAVAPYTFGVYLLHEHLFIRYEWVKWLQVSGADNVFMFIINLVWKCLIVLVIGLIADFVRAKVFDLCIKVFRKEKQ